MDRSQTTEQLCSTPDQYEDEELDPRVKVELDRLNRATDEINKLESALEDANNSFRHDLSECSSNLQALGRKLGSAVEKARPYFEAMLHAKKLHLDCQRTAVQYHRANAVHQAARTTISLAEERFSNPNHQNQRQFDPAWQEMLNHATRKVLEAEAGRSASEREHERRAAAYTAAQQRAATLARQLKGPINKARPYFEQKERFDSQMEHMSQRVNQLQRAVASAKLAYSHALRNLEQISEEIHEQRRCDACVREPGVGAEDLPEGEQVMMQDWSCVPSMESDDKGLKTYDDLATDGDITPLTKGRCVSGSSTASAGCSERSDVFLRGCGSGDKAPVFCGAPAAASVAFNTCEDDTKEQQKHGNSCCAGVTSRIAAASVSADCHNRSIEAALANTAHDIDRISHAAHIMVTSLSLTSYSDESLFKTNPTGAEKSLSYIDTSTDLVTDELASRRKQRTRLDFNHGCEKIADKKEDDSCIIYKTIDSVVDPSGVTLIFSEDRSNIGIDDGKADGCENGYDSGIANGNDCVNSCKGVDEVVNEGDICNTKTAEVVNCNDSGIEDINRGDIEHDNSVSTKNDNCISTENNNDVEDSVVEASSPCVINSSCDDGSTAEVQVKAVKSAALSTS